MPKDFDTNSFQRFCSLNQEPGKINKMFIDISTGGEGIHVLSLDYDVDLLEEG